MTLKDVLETWYFDRSEKLNKTQYIDMCYQELETFTRDEPDKSTEWRSFWRSNCIRTYTFIIAEYDTLSDRELELLVKLSRFYQKKDLQGLGEICIFFANFKLFTYLAQANIIRISWNDIYACVCPSGSISLHSKIKFDVHPMSGYHTVNSRTGREKNRSKEESKHMIVKRLQILKEIFRIKPLFLGLLYRSRERLYWMHREDRYAKYRFSLTYFVHERWSRMYNFLDIANYVYSDDEEEEEVLSEPKVPFDYDTYSSLFTFSLVQTRKLEKELRAIAFSRDDLHTPLRVWIKIKKYYV